MNRFYNVGYKLISAFFERRDIMFEDYHSSAHSVYRLTYHAVFVVKYRRKVISTDIMDHMEQYTRYLLEERYHGQLIEFNGEEDHVHILFELPPSASPSTTVCNLKTQLSKSVRANFGEQIKNRLWKNSFWSDSYFLTTTGGANLETLKEYVRQQGIVKQKRKYVRRN